MCGGRVVTDDQGSLLTAFQVEVAQLFFSLPASGGFLLAGGGALLAHGLTARPTQDLDFFTRPGAGDVGLARDQFLAAAGCRDWTVERVQDSESFCRLLVHGPEDLLVDLALDSAPGRPAGASIAGPTFAPDELAGRKVIALFDRAAASIRVCSSTCSGTWIATAMSIWHWAMSTSIRCGRSSSNGSPNKTPPIDEAG